MEILVSLVICIVSTWITFGEELCKVLHDLTLEKVTGHPVT